MSQKTIRILQLYPHAMNIYGDWGNTLVLQQRAEWHGYSVELLEYNVGDTFPSSVDIIVGGGGQDSGQTAIREDLQKIAKPLRALAASGTPMLVICGLYQLFGNFFKTKDGEVIDGIGIFDAETHGGPERLIGNTVVESTEFGEIIGYENHSGKTTLGANAQPFGTVRSGAGNNGDDKTEGARYKNVIGTYMHGSLLPKNPQVADWLIKQAVTRRYGSFTPQATDDTFTRKAREIALTRPR